MPFPPPPIFQRGRLLFSLSDLWAAESFLPSFSDPKAEQTVFVSEQRQRRLCSENSKTLLLFSSDL